MATALVVLVGSALGMQSEENIPIMLDDVPEAASQTLQAEDDIMGGVKVNA